LATFSLLALEAGRKRVIELYRSVQYRQGVQKNMSSPKRAARSDEDSGPDAKRLSIVAAAREVFLREGFQAASMEQIAATADVSKVTIYSKFGSKQDLFSAIVDDICEQILAMEIVIPETMASVEEALIELAVDYAEVLYDPDVLALVRLAIGESRAPRELGRLYYQAGPMRARQGIVGLFGSLAESGELLVDDPELAADQFLALLQPQRYYVLLDPSTLPTKTDIAMVARRGVEVFLSHYRPSQAVSAP
jgi:TetR/AcrR family transcriptional regulator, mexJK operon transcriptional repressor